MPRMYTARFEQVAVSAAQDLFQVSGAAGKIVRVVRVKIGATDTTIPTSQMLSFKTIFFPATVTNGSGGSTPLVNKVDQGDAAASLSVLANNTTAATTSGTAVILSDFSEHIYNGLDLQHSLDGRDGIPAPIIGPSEAWTIALLSVVSGTVHLSGSIWLAEYGG